MFTVNSSLFLIIERGLGSTNTIFVYSFSDGYFGKRNNELCMNIL